nr:hypothetical protein [uncultured Cohaesibacter sp.]
MAEKATGQDHVYLKDRMSGRRGWLKYLVYGLSGIVLLTMLASNLMQSF